MDALTFVVLGIACFRLTHLIVSDEITSFVRAPFVDEVNEPDADGRWIKLQYPRMPLWRGYVGSLISCPWCTGIWVGALLVGGWYIAPGAVFLVAAIFAVSGLGVSVEMATRYWNVNSLSPTDAQVRRINEINALLLQGGVDQNGKQRSGGSLQDARRGYAPEQRLTEKKD